MSHCISQARQPCCFLVMSNSLRMLYPEISLQYPQQMTVQKHKWRCWTHLQLQPNSKFLLTVVRSGQPLLVICPETCNFGVLVPLKTHPLARPEIFQPAHYCATPCMQSLFFSSFTKILRPRPPIRGTIPESHPSTFIGISSSLDWHFPPLSTHAYFSKEPLKPFLLLTYFFRPHLLPCTASIAVLCPNWFKPWNKLLIKERQPLKGNR